MKSQTPDEQKRDRLFLNAQQTYNDARVAAGLGRWGGGWDVPPLADEANRHKGAGQAKLETLARAVIDALYETQRGGGPQP